MKNCSTEKNLCPQSCLLSDARPTAVKTAYVGEDVVVADVVATDAPYGCDPTGQIDSSAALQAAIDDCHKAGGGVVFLPAGEYVISQKITLPHGVVLQGDWQDPDGVPAGEATYGTVILAKPATLPADAPRHEGILFYVSDNAGIVGLTVYYPEQDLTAVKCYGYALYIGHSGTATLRNITVLNAYRGIGVCTKAEWHDMTKLEHVRVTALETALEMHFSADVGYTYDFKISPRYWIEAGRGFAVADSAALTAYCRRNLTGMILGDLDLEVLSEIVIEGCHVGLLFHAIHRAGFWGEFYDLYISDCDYGIVAQEISGGNPPMIARGRVEGTVLAIKSVYRRTPIRLCDVELVGGTEGCLLVEEEDLSAIPFCHGTYQKPADCLYALPIASLSKTSEDISDLLQQTLNEAAKTGGVVRIPAGVYTLKKPVTVPSGVQLAGCMPIYTRDMRNDMLDGTVLISYVDAEATITLQENAGVSGLRLWFPQYDTITAHEMLTAGHPATKTQAAVRGVGRGVYVCEVTVNGGFTGVDVRGCDNHLVRSVYGCSYVALVCCGGKDGFVEQCLSNPNFLDRRILDPYFFHISDTERERWKHLMDPTVVGETKRYEIGHVGFDFMCSKVFNEYGNMIHVVNADNQTVNNTFMYTPHSLILCENSQNVVILNSSVDVLSKDYPMFDMRNSSARVVGAMRVYGRSVKNQNSVVDINCRNDRRDIWEKPYHSSVSIEDIKEFKTPTEFISLNTCDTMDGIAGAVQLTHDPAYVKEGSGAFYCEYDSITADPILIYKFADTDISSLEKDGYLHMWVYCSDASQIAGGQIELCSSGQNDVEELGWSLGEAITKNGWNELYLPLNDGNMTGGEIDATHVNFLRLYPAWGHCTLAVDDIYICR